MANKNGNCKLLIYIQTNYFIKKLSIILVILLAAISCNKKNETITPVAKTQYAQKNVNDLIAKINSIGLNYKKNNLNRSGNKITTAKGTKMALADAIGGVLAGASSAGTGFLAGYIALWGGFSLSMFVASSSVIHNPVNPLPSTTGSSAFAYGYIGDDHNVLLYTAFVNNISISANSNNTLNQATENLLASTSFSNINGGNGDISSFFSNNESIIGGQLNYASNIVTDDNFCTKMLNYYISDQNLYSVLNAIINDIQTDISNESDCNSYLLQVQSVVQ